MSMGGSDSQRLGGGMRRARLAAGLTLEELASRSGMSVRAISNLERGRTQRPREGSIRLLAAALGLAEPAPAELLKPCHSDRHDGVAGHTAASPQERPPTAPHQLPATARTFTGRAAEMRTLNALLEQAVTRADTVVISAIGGMAGVGKTALALQWAHRVTNRFPDGQLYANLRGFDPVRDPVASAEVLRNFLDALGIPAGRVPASPDAQAGLYRSLLAGKRMLVMLDNARGEDQIRPLLPASPGCLVLVTSRRQLTGLVAGDGADLVVLDTLTEDDARQLLSCRTGADRAAAEPAAVGELIELCGRLPLALVIIAARAATRPGVPLAMLAAELRDTAGRLNALDTSDTDTSVGAAFSCSYRHLSPAAAQMFRLLGLHPGPAITTIAAARLARTSPLAAAAAVGELTQAHLLDEELPGQYAFHDLLRAYAAQQAGTVDSPAEQAAALTCLFDYYLAVAGTAMDTLAPAEQQRRPAVGPPGPGSPPVSTPDSALRWLDAERANLVAIARHAAHHGWPGHATRLGVILFRYLDDGGHHLDALIIYTQALEAARQAGDRMAQAHMLRNLSAVDYRQGRYDQAGQQLQEALAIYFDLGDRSSQGRTLVNLGLVLWRQGSYRAAIDHYRQAVTIVQDLGDKLLQASVLDNMGVVFCRLGRYLEAASYHRQALALFRDLGDRRGAVGAVDNLGAALRGQGLAQEAADCHEMALAAFRELSCRDGEADALNRLAAALCVLGRYEVAVSYLGQARAMFRDLGNRSDEADALNNAGEALTALGQLRQASAHHRDALILARDVRDPYQKARAHEGLARAHDAVGDISHARIHRERAAAYYRDKVVIQAGQASTGSDGCSPAHLNPGSSTSP
ncbi:MAG: tetratricopeptide repeat protein [Actinomycetota bacterium]|nr:tetratricopeptide repeat protein [Actinomycetota bacterium]